MEYLNYIEQQLGLMAWPLILCSMLTLILIFDRLVLLGCSYSLARAKVAQRLNAIRPSDKQAVVQLAQEFSQRRALTLQAVATILNQSSVAKSLREDIAEIWLQEKRHHLQSGIKVLTLIGVISPLLGLLGTVLGLIEMFKGVAASSGNITPNDLAEGLGLAMRTTAAGLIIALPAIVSAQMFTLWSERLISRAEHAMNRVNLWLEGVNISPASPSVTESDGNLTEKSSSETQAQQS